VNEIQSIISRLEHQRTAIERALAALREVEGSGTPAARKQGKRGGRKRVGGKRRMSPEGRARIAEATRKRWADKRAADAAAATKKAAKKKGGKKAAGSE